MTQPHNNDAMNLMADLHSRMVSLPLTFRERVCSECNWSIPTFYRKMRPSHRIVDGGKEVIIPLLSNAEKEKIIAVSDEVYKEFWEYCEKYRKRNGKG